MSHEDFTERTKARRKPVKPRVASRPERRGSLDRLVARIDARHGDNRFGAALRAGNLVRQMRHEAGLSQRALGKALGVSQARISEIEAGTGAQGPTWMLMERIAEACGHTIGVMLASLAERQAGADVQAMSVADPVRMRTLPVFIPALGRDVLDSLGEIGARELVSASKAAAKSPATTGQEAAPNGLKALEVMPAVLTTYTEVKSLSDSYRVRGVSDAAVAGSARVSETVLNLMGDSAVGESDPFARALTELHVFANEFRLEGGVKATKRQPRGRGKVSST